MKKIPTMFKREFEGHKVVKVLPEFTNEKCAKAACYGLPTVKFDGSCCAVIDGVFYKRYDAKKGKPIPDGAIKCQEEADPVTGHLPCWVKVDFNDPANKWFVSAYKNYIKGYYEVADATYEAIGPHFQGNPYGLTEDTLIQHGVVPVSGDCTKLMVVNRAKDAKGYLEDVREYLESHEIEGLVYWYYGVPICKIKRSDFGLPWPVKKGE